MLTVGGSIYVRPINIMYSWTCIPIFVCTGVVREGCATRVCDNWSTAVHAFLSCRGFAFHSLSCDWYGHCGFCAFLKFLQGHFINWGHYCARQRHLFWLSWYYNVCRVLLANYYRLMCGTPKHLLQACMAKRTVTQASPSKQDDQKTVCFVVIIVFSAPSEHNTI